jgi:ElaB/YqjD/DUF883 family membrane-anchored ribosome-binding protein
MTTRTHARANGKHRGATSHIGGVIDRTEALLAATAELSDEKLVSLRESLEGDLEAARGHLEQLEVALKRKATFVDEFVHENPWPVIGVAAGAGVLSGVLVGALAFRR